jgi:hypothetical protein
MDSYVARVQGTPSLTEGEMNHLNIDENGNLLCNIAQGSFAVSTGAQYNVTPPVLADGQTGPLQCDVNGKMLISGSINATSAATYNSSPPTYSSGTSNPLQADVNGNLKVNLTNNGLGALASPVRTDPTGTTTQPVSGTVSVGNFPATQPISAAALPLPSGAATSAKQPALGGAGTPSADVLTVQGVTSMTPLKVDGSAITQPVSGTVGVSSLPSIPAGGNAIGSVSVSNFPATQPVSGTVSISGTPSVSVSGAVSINSIPSGSNTIGSVKLTDGTDTATIESLTNAKALDVAIVDGSGNQITSFGGGTQYADGATQSTPTGTVALGKNGSNVLHALSLDGSGNLNVAIQSGGGSGGTSSNFGSAFPSTGTAIGASDGTNMQGLLVESSTNKNLRVGLYSGTNEATVTASNALKVDGSAVTQPVSASSLPLPSGAATSAKQPALGTAGSASTDVLTVQGIASMTALKVDGSAVTQPVSGSVSTVPSTSGGCSFTTGSVGNTVTAIKASAGQLYGYDVYNKNTAETYIQVFNAGTGSVTLGSTAPDLVIVLPPSGGRNVCYNPGIAFSTAMSFACTTTRTGSTAPSNPVDVNFFYK